MNVIGNWVFAEAAILARQWSVLAGLPFQININVSAMQFTAAAGDMNCGAQT